MKQAIAILLISLTLSLPAFAQVQTYSLAPVARQQFFTNAGAPVASGFLCIYAAGTTTPATWYSDNSGTALPDPIRLNSAGIAQTGISGAGTETGLYLSGLSYKVNLYASGTGNTCNGVAVGALIRSQDNVYDVALISRTLLVATFAVIPYAPTISFDTSTTSIFELTLTGNVSGTTFANGVVGSIIDLTIKQDGTGNRTFAWPAAALAPPIVGSAANDYTRAMFYYDGTYWQPMALNGTQSATGFKFTGTIGIVDSAAGAGVVTVATSSGSATYTLKLPASAGSSTQFLQTDGTGTTTFAFTPLQPPGGRLTTETGVPISTTDRTAQGTIYYTPYLNNLIWVYNGTTWIKFNFSELSLALTVTSGKNYDVFVYSNSGTLTLELSAAWTNDTTRANALTTQDGVFVKSGATTRLWLGTIRASGANVTADSIGGVSSQVGGQGYVCNFYNQVLRPLKVIDTTGNWSYTTITIRQANGATGNKVEAIFCNAGMAADATISAALALVSNSARGAIIGIGIDSTTTISGFSSYSYNANAASVQPSMNAKYNGYPGIGYHFFSWNESGADGTCIFFGNQVTGSQSGLVVLTPR